MGRYILGRRSGVFKLQWFKDEIDVDNLNREYDVWWECSHTSCCTDYHYRDYKSKGVCAFDFGEALRIGNFTVDQTMAGSWSQVNDFSKTRTSYGCSVRDATGRKAIIEIEGFDMQLEISKLLNRLVQFDCLEDLLAVNVALDKNRWKSLALADKICELGDIIKLYKKYREVNSATSIVMDIEELIEGRLKELMQA